MLILVDISVFIGFCRNIYSSCVIWSRVRLVNSFQGKRPKWKKPISDSSNKHTHNILYMFTNIHTHVYLCDFVCWWLMRFSCVPPYVCLYVYRFSGEFSHCVRAAGSWQNFRTGWSFHLFARFWDLWLARAMRLPINMIHDFCNLLVSPCLNAKTNIYLFSCSSPIAEMNLFMLSFVLCCCYLIKRCFIVFFVFICKCLIHSKFYII